MRVLVVEDDLISAELIAYALSSGGYDVTIVPTADEAFSLIRTGRFQLVVSDWEMPGGNGLDLCRRIRARECGRYVYVILLTSYDRPHEAVLGLDGGADDFLTKPFHPHELQMRLKVGERILSQESRDVTIFVLAKLAESRDKETGWHLEKIREYCRVIAEHLAEQSVGHNDPMQLDGEYVSLLYETSPLHDIGKVGIPDEVLLKPGKLTSEEFEIMKQHCAIGANTLDAALRVQPEARYLSMARDIALTHHEKYDGSGYPEGLKGEEIPLCGRITALADVYDALTSDRVYKRAFSHEKSKSIILEGRGTHFDPCVVAAFEACESEFIRIRERFSRDASHTVRLDPVTGAAGAALMQQLESTLAGDETAMATVAADI